MKTPLLLFSLLFLLGQHQSFAQNPDQDDDDDQTPTSTPAQKPSTMPRARATPNPLNEDMFLQARLEQASTTWLIEKTRILLANTKINDKFQDELKMEEIPPMVLEDVSKDPDFKRYRDALSGVFKVDLTKAAIRIRIPKLYYKLDSLHAKPLALNVKDPNLDLRADAMIHGLTIKLTQGIAVDFMIPNPKTQVLESYFSANVKDIALSIPQNIAPLTFEVNFRTLRGVKDFKFELLGSNFDLIPAYVNDNFKLISITSGPKNEAFGAEHIKINPVTVRLNDLTRTIELDTFRPFIQKKIPLIMTSVMKLVAQTLKKNLGPKILKTVFASKMTSEVNVSTANLFTRFNTVSFSQPTSTQLSLGISGDICTAKTYKDHKELCNLHEPTIEPVREISEAVMQKAHDEVNQTLAQGTADVACSISEEYLNRLLKTTVYGNLWEDMLKKYNLKVGPKGSFVILNQKTKTPELFIDMLFMGNEKTPRVIVNENKPLRFPLHMTTSMSFVVKEGIPFLVLKVEKLLSTEDEIIDGIPEYDLPSKIVKLFKKKISKAVIEMATQVEGITALDLDIPVFKNVELEKTTYEISPYGRLNIFFKL